MLKEGSGSDLSDVSSLLLRVIDCTGYVDSSSEKSTVCPGGAEEVAGYMTSVH